jgi:thiamine transport system permease protein
VDRQLALDHAVSTATPDRRIGARRWVVALAAAVPLGFLALTYLWPLVSLLHQAFPTSSWHIVGDTLGNRRIGRIALVTVAQASISTAVALVIGVPAAWAHSRLSFPLRRATWLLTAVPFVLPTVVVAAGFLAVTGSEGLGGGATGSWLLVVVAHVAINVGVIVRTVGARIASIDPEIEWAARSLGRRWWRAAWDVTIRGAGDAIRGAALVVFLFCLTSFGIVVILGGGSVTTVEVEVWYVTTRLFRLDAGAVLALAQLVIVVVVLWAYERTRDRRRALVSRSRTAPRRRPASGGEWALVVASVVVPLALAGVPLGALVVRSLRVADGWGFQHYTDLFRDVNPAALSSPAIASLGMSMLIALVAAVLALVVALPATYALAVRGSSARVLDLLLMLPLATSAATVGFGILVAYHTPPFDLRGSWWAVPLVEASIAAPLVIRVLAPIAAGIDPRQLDAAASLGAGSWRRFGRIVWPAIRPGVGMGAGLAFAVALGEFGAVSFLTRTDSPTVPQVIHRFLGRPGDANVGQAMALGVVLALVTAVVFAVFDGIGRGRSLEF